MAVKSSSLSKGPLTRSLTRSITAAGGGGGFSPNAAFFAGAKGFSLDLTDMSTLFQDSARTTPVTATGQPIGSPSDLSGNNAHPTQATGVNRPTYDGWATFDGGNDSWVTPAIDLTATSVVTIVVGVRKSSDAALGSLVESGANRTTSRAFGVRAPAAASATYDFGCTGVTGTAVATTAASYAAPITNVLTAKLDISKLFYDALGPIRIDGAQVTAPASGAGVTTAGTFGNLPVYIGRAGGTLFPFNGRIYRMIVIGRALTAAETLQAEAWCADPFS